MSLTQDRLREVLHYDPEMGTFTWLVDLGVRAKAGTPAARPGKAPYCRVTIDRQKYYAHHLAWLYVYGVMPDMLDHKSLDTQDNRIENLRLADKRRNAANIPAHRDNACGVKGVYRVGDRWRAMIKTGGKSVHIGYYDSAEEAGQAYLTAATAAFGEFARLGEHDGA